MECRRKGHRQRRWEDCFLESGIATAATALALSDRLKVGVGLLPVPLRNVALATMEAATLYRLFPGRVLLGLGHGVQDWMGRSVPVPSRR
ncbi:LLM class flavin-dependent oxidoreductase [Kibdelosporangium phytohabitans]|uniref:LLM class flavin-dependent oxidoreductase n=1 Tax=Kibdelosporangium phytohabitans TaxID=860235 RepID=UPI000A6C9C2E|nr:LLM class flavin-dependent oxidoreductase [Kibdelosporangium phytohabitans]MBE1471113.1 alkanesulfonate monooxygenase SsuD/methylene tetrahydromethanopterin reductase-like flavin-dependent oxidoreductase (luciferase family) [Kibdelosporangium phytohabitans]